MRSSLSVLGCLLAAAVVLAMPACSPKAPPPINPAYAAPNRVPPDPSEPVTPVSQPVASVSQVVVEPGAGQLPSERLERFRSHDADSILRRAIFAGLSERGRVDTASEYWIAVRVTGFRLRSTNAALWAGAMAGNDGITAEVSVGEAESIVERFSVHVSSIKGGVLYPASTGRLNNLAIALAEQIVERLGTE